MQHTAASQIVQMMQRRSAPTRHGVEQYTFAQRRIGDHQFVDAEFDHRLLENEGAAEDDVGTARVHAREFPTIIVRGRSDQSFHRPLDIAARHHEVVEGTQRSPAIPGM